MGKKTLVTVVAAAALVVALAIIAASSLRPRATGQGPAPGGDPAAEREATAERLFAQAQLAMDRADWTAVIAILDRLWVECGSTRFLEANRATVSRMLAQAKSKLAVAVRPPIPPPKKPPPAPDPEPNLAEALREWPVAFEDKLASRECLKRGWLFKGQYGGHFEVKGALRVSGMHTISAVWWRQPVGDDFLLSVDVCPEDNATPLIWLCGPGYGTSPGTGYLLRVSVLEKQFRFDRHGQAWGPPHVPGPRWGEWYHIDVLRHRRVLALHINGQQVGRWHDPAPLRGPANAFIGFGSHLGFSGKRGAWFRQMTIRMPEEEAQRLKKAPVERILDPPLTVLPRPNGERLAHDGFGQGVISRWSAARREWGIHETKEGLVLRGPNAWPRPWRVEAFTAPFALDLPMSYFPNGEAVNFSVRLRHGDALDKGRERYRGWTLSFPAGDGLVALDWHDEEGKAHRSAQNAYFAPVPGRQYVLRLELARERLRVFSNGALILAGRSPRPIADGEPVYLGFRQIYGGSRVRHVTVHRIDPEHPLAGQAVEPGDFGPRLAASANLAAAWRAIVCPLLAERRYVDAQVALTRLTVRPEFALAEMAAANAERDMNRLLRFWAAARPLAEANPEQDVLAVLGPPFLQEPEHRLQAALFLMVDGRGDPKRALSLLGAIEDHPDAARYRAMAERQVRSAAHP